jgi:pimeloyl-ACP methyl ester carboxylesterase
VLAHLLLSGAHGDRPVKLVAHGMGARLVFHCLLELCRQGARGVVEHAVLMGCPVGTEGVRWRMARRAVAGRLVNVYTRKDWLLGVMAGGSSGWMKATAGLVPIEGVQGLENFNLTNLVEGHFGYIEELPAILDMLLL